MYINVCIPVTITHTTIPIIQKNVYQHNLILKRWVSETIKKLEIFKHSEYKIRKQVRIKNI